MNHPVSPEFSLKLMNCRSIFVKNYVSKVAIGVYEHEKVAPQTMVFNITAYVNRTAASPKNDALNEVVDYDFVRNTIVQQLKGEHVQLQETLCDRIGEALLKNSAILAAYVRSEKTDIYPDCDAIGVGAWYLQAI